MISVKMLSIECCDSLQQMPNFSGGVSEGCIDTSQAIKKEREMPENRSYADDKEGWLVSVWKAKEESGRRWGQPGK